MAQTRVSQVAAPGIQRSVMNAEIAVVSHVCHPTGRRRPIGWTRSQVGRVEFLKAVAEPDDEGDIRRW
jgi:hypothetical protein